MMHNTSPPDADHVHDVCKIGQGSDCCRYLTCGAKGFSCAKGTDLKAYLDFRVSCHTMTAEGDNCEGRGSA